MMHRVWRGAGFLSSYSVGTVVVLAHLVRFGIELHREASRAI